MLIPQLVAGFFVGLAVGVYKDNLLYLAGIRPRRNFMGIEEMASDNALKEEYYARNGKNTDLARFLVKLTRPLTVEEIEKNI